MAEEKEERIERLPSAVTAQMLAGEEGLFLNVARFEHAQRVAKMLAESTMVPDHFRGNVGNCLIALNLAQRMRLDPFMLMQSIYVVHGRPGIEGKLVIALIEGHGRFGPLHFKFEGKGITGKKISRPNSCVAYAVDLKTKETVEGPEVTWEMVDAEGWNKGKKYRDGSGEMPSKWETMPELMFMYRAASFFGRVHDPGALMGFRSLEEVEDMEIVNVTPIAPAVDRKAEERQRKYQAFCDSIPEGTAPELLDEFLKRTGEANRVNKDEAMVMAADDLPRFWELFDKFKSKKSANDGAKREEGKKAEASEPIAPTDPPASSPPPEEKPKGNGIPGSDGNASALDRVRFIEKTYPDIFKAACKNTQIDYPLNETAAIIVRNEAIRLFKQQKK